MRSVLGRKIFFPALLTIALGLVAILAAFYFQAREVVRQEMVKRLEREAQLAVRLVDSWLVARKNDLATWARQDVFRETLLEGGYYGRSALQGAHRLLETLQGGYSFYESIFLADLQGTVTAHAIMEAADAPVVRVGDRPYFRETLTGRQVISSLITSRVTGRQVFMITAPVISEGTVVGVLCGVVDFSAFKRFFLDDFKIKRHGYAYLVEPGQTVLASSRDNEATLSEQGRGLFLARIVAADHGTFLHQMDEGEVLTVFQQVHETPWSLAINQSLDNTLRPLQRIIEGSALAALAVLLCIALTLAGLFHRLIIARLQGMLQVIRAVGEGDLGRRLPQQARRPDEISDLTDSFNAMIEQLGLTLTSLSQEVAVRKLTEAELALHQENLERTIEERSAELEKEVTERRRAEEKLVRAEKLEMIGTLAGGVAHDLNNILSGIVSYPDLLLLQLPADSPLRKPMQTIKESGEKMAAIVQDLLTLARRGVAVKEPVNLNQLISDYLASPEFSLLATRHPGVRVQVDCAPDLFAILGSPVHLAKTLMNLVTNAAESMEGGGVIRLFTENRSVDHSLALYERIGQGEYAVLKVEDQGVGIRPEDMDKIFEPFYTSKKMGRSGTGLGMAVVWGTVKDHQGYIDCESRVGSGTRFTLYFPVTPQVHRQRLDAAPPEDWRGRGERILVVDDVEEQRQIASSILSELGYRVVLAASGEEAADLARTERFDLLLLDMILGPGMDGLDTYKRWLALHPGQKAVITSGFSETERIAEALRIGVGRYIKKPYTIAKLGEAIRKELDREQTAGAASQYSGR